MNRCPECHGPLENEPAQCPRCRAPLAGYLLADRFRLVRRLGRGGLGTVWLTEDTQLNNDRVACKILKSDLQNDARAISDLKREVLLTRRLRHHNILGVYSFWETGQERLITMEYVDGDNLWELLHGNSGPFAPPALLAWLDQIGAALDYAHGEGVLHRDVKPANIMLARDGRILLADFGIARMAREVRARLTGELTSGTLLYVSPEQLMGERLDGRSDQYSLAATAYELLAGTPPFHSGSIITQIQLKPAPPVPGLGDEINEVLLRGLAKDPGRRFDRCGAFCQALADAIRALENPAIPIQAELFPELDPNQLEAAEDTTVALSRQDTAAIRMRLGTLLIEDGLLTDDQLVQALEIQKVRRERLGAILMADLGLSEAAIARALSRQIQLPCYERLPLDRIDLEIAHTVTEAIARARSCLPLWQARDQVALAMTDPLDLRSLNDFEATFGAAVQPVITTATALEEGIAFVWGRAPG